MKARSICSFVFFIIALVGLGGCSLIPFAPANATDTPTRTPRPTFTPRPSATLVAQSTDTPSPTDTPAPTDTPLPTPTEAQPTKKPAAPQPTKIPRPTTPPQPTTPTFPITATDHYPCNQDGIYEVVINAKRGKVIVGGLYFAALALDGRLLHDGAGKDLISQTDSSISVSIGSNCKQQADFTNPNASNGKLDVGDPARAGTTNILIRFIKSPTDLTPLSPDYAINFGSGGRWWFYIQAK